MVATTQINRRAEPRWRPLRRLNRSALPDKYLPWLLDPESLTQRLIAHCRHVFRVQLVSQRRARPMRNEAVALGILPGDYAIVREVQLRCGETAWVYARTVIPPGTLTGKHRRFRHLGSRSLGAFLFADPTLARGELEITRLSAGDALYHQITRETRATPPEIWGRRSVFRVNDKPLLVAEFFLPEIPDFTP